PVGGGSGPPTCLLGAEVADFSAGGSGPQLVRAAGGAVHRGGSGRGGELEVLLVHRPAYDDWTLPKGKLQSGESEEEAALREVEEETGLACKLGPELVTTSYVDMRGRPKTVRYWAMVPCDETALRTDGAEVDGADWLGLSLAAGRLSYARDASVLVALAEALSEG
ncbi:MAG: NUDIX hydrolase, partial [Acidimicrobiales bacterium]